MTVFSCIHSFIYLIVYPESKNAMGWFELFEAAFFSFADSLVIGL